MNSISKVYKAIIGGLVLLLVFLLAGPAGAEVSKATNHKILENYGKLPLSFEANQGQSDAQVKFLSRGRRHTLFLTSTDAVLVLNKSEQSGNGKPEGKEKVTQTVLRMTLIGANPKPSVAGLEELPGKANYFIGNDPKKWHTNVPTYAKVIYKDVYPGIDLIYYGNQSQLEYDFVVSPGADPKAIKLAFEGTEKIEVDAQGDLILQTAGGQINFKMHKPLAYQVVNGVRKEISGSYVLNSKSAIKNPTSRSVSFQVATYDRSRPLVIDPVLSYSTYLGGSGIDQGELHGIAVDALGNAYVTGTTSSTNFPTTIGAFQTTFGGGGLDAFVTKINPTGSGLVYSTYLGGSGDDDGSGIAVDALGNAYVAGTTSSTNFPTTPGAFQTTVGGFEDAFVTKLNPTGSGLVYSTYLGGSGQDFGRGVALDSAGSAYVTGFTRSTNFPTTIGAFQTTFGGGFGDAFVTKINPSGTGLVYSTYLGGSGDDGGGGIAVDSMPNPNAYVTGTTSSINFPTTPGAFQTTFGGGPRDAFVTKIATATQQATTLAFTAASATTADFHDAAQVQARLTTSSGAPVPNETVTFTLGSGPGAPTCSANTDVTGTATCLITPNQPAGTVTLTATFAGDASFAGSSASTTFIVTKEETTLKFTATSPTLLASGQPATFSATLKEDGVTPISGRTVTITLGSGAGAQSCAVTTDSSGTANCTITVNQPLGPNTVTANFASDAFFRPSSDTKAVLVFAFLGGAAGGSFVIGDGNAVVGNSVIFWSAQWAKANSLSGGPAPAAFKGFASHTSTTPPTCGGTWTTPPGNSSNPPATVPSFMVVIAASSITQSGPTISGNIPRLVIVKTNPGYGPAPGHTGTGTVVAVLCGP
jgi:hypothetical protein